MSCAVPLANMSDCLNRIYEDYNELWKALHSAVAKVKKVLPEESSLEAWKRAGEDFQGVGLTGRLKFLAQPNGPVYELSLQPLKLEASYRFARKYGHDRFCVILLPSLGSDSLPPYLKPSQAAAHETIIQWLVETEHCLLGRRWRVCYVKPESTRKSQKADKDSSTDARYHVYLFAEDGVNFRREPLRGEMDPRNPSHCRVTIRELLEWFMSSMNNSDQTVLKLFNRIGMGSYPSIGLIL